MDFSHEELFEVIDRIVSQLLERAGVDRAPIDALRIAEEHLGIPIEMTEPNDDEPPTRRHSAGIVLASHMTHEQQQLVAARGIARSLMPDLFRKLDLVLGPDSRQAANQFTGILASRLLVPSKMLRSAQRTCKADLPALHDIFRSTSPETVAMRLLDLDEPCVIAVVDDGIVSVRRGNMPAVSKKLTTAELQCAERVMELDLPNRVRADGWTVQGWPVPNRPFRRVVLRAVPDDV